MHEGQPYFGKPRKNNGEDSDGEYTPETALSLTKEPLTPTKRSRYDPEGEYTYPPPPAGNSIAQGYWVHPDRPGPSAQRDQTRTQPLPPGRTQQPVRLPGTRVHPTNPPPVSSNSLSPAKPPFPARQDNGASRRSSDPSPPFADGPRVGEQIPADIAAAANGIKLFHRDHGQNPPRRQELKDRNIDSYIRQHFNSRDGMMRSDSVLREWYGDTRLFPTNWWEFFVWQKAREKSRTGTGE